MFIETVLSCQAVKGYLCFRRHCSVLLCQSNPSSLLRNFQFMVSIPC